jgi:hypothetical protein
VERRAGAGTVLTWTSSLDSFWNDLALRPVFVPFVHQAMRHLGKYAEAKAWREVGDVLDPADVRLGPGSGARDLALGASSDGKTAPTPSRPTVLAPSGKTVEFADPARNTVELKETGFYEIRRDGEKAGESAFVAVNVPAAESDLAPFDPAELVTAATGGAVQASGGAALPPAPSWRQAWCCSPSKPTSRADSRASRKDDSHGVSPRGTS